MSRNKHDRSRDHFGTDLDTNILLNGAVGSIPDGTSLHDALGLATGDPAFGLMGAPYTLTSKTARYTSTQTTTVLWTPASGKKLVITAVQIQCGGTTAGELQLYFAAAATAYSRGTTPAVFDGEFAPSSTLKPGVILTPSVPYIAPTADNRLFVTDSAGINPLTITVWGYEV